MDCIRPVEGFLMRTVWDAVRRGGNRGSAAVKAGPWGVIKCEGPITTTVVVVVSRMTG